MKKYESYSAAYPLAYYELGVVYAFYGRANTSATPATADQIRKYSFALEELTEGNAATGKSYQMLNRYYAVVVDKVNAGTNSYITVMFHANVNGVMGYYIRKYGVGTSCWTDSKELMQPSGCVRISGCEAAERGVTGSTKVGGITRAIETEKVGGITKATTEEKPSYTGIGGITKAEPAKKVGGITRAVKQESEPDTEAHSDASETKRVGGITRA